MPCTMPPVTLSSSGSVISTTMEREAREAWGVSRMISQANSCTPLPSMVVRIVAGPSSTSDCAAAGRPCG